MFILTRLNRVENNYKTSYPLMEKLLFRELRNLISQTNCRLFLLLLSYFHSDDKTEFVFCKY